MKKVQLISIFLGKNFYIFYGLKGKKIEIL